MAGPILKKLPVAAASLAPAWVSTASASGANADYGNIRFHRETIDGVGIHYEEAGDPGRPTLVHAVVSSVNQLPADAASSTARPCRLTLSVSSRGGSMGPSPRRT